jgi:hypothetical protein
MLKFKNQIQRSLSFSGFKNRDLFFCNNSKSNLVFNWIILIFLRPILIFIRNSFLILLFLAGCSDTNLPKYSQLSGLRILALKAQPAEVNPGETVTITPVVSDVTEATQLSYSAFTCMDSGIALGAEPTCNGNPTKVTLTSGSISTLTAIKAFTGLADSITVTVPDSQTILAQRSSAQKYNGVSYIFEYILQNSNGEQVKSIKRLLVSDVSKTSKNTNPDISDLLVNGGTIGGTIESLPLATEVETSLTYNGSPVESFQKMESNGQLRDEVEELVTTWFVTDGKMSYQRTIGLDNNKYEGPQVSPVGRPAYLIGITRDGRGGASTIIKCFGSCN